MSKFIIETPTEVDSISSLRDQIIELRDEALKQGDFKWTVILSHTIAWMSAVKDGEPI